MNDLTISVYVLFNYLESNRNIPWADLRYLFGEIMYGGHITDDWDRRLCQTYLNEFMQVGLLTGDLSFCNDFQAPPVLDLSGYHQYINGESICHTYMNTEINLMFANRIGEISHFGFCNIDVGMIETLYERCVLINPLQLSPYL